MALCLFDAKIIANVPMAIMLIVNMINAVSTNESSPSPIQMAERAQHNLFVIYVVVLVVGGLLAALFTVLVWRAGNRYQDAVQADAKVRLEEARDSAARADERAAKADERAALANAEAAKANESAAKLNERAQALERDNLVLRDDVNKAAGEVAKLQTEAANARAAQQKVETELAKQRERAANAELALEELRRRQAPRSLDFKKFVEALKDKPKAKVEILYQPNDTEAYNFAVHIRRWLGPGDGDGAGWEVLPPKPIPPEGGDARFPIDAPPSLRFGAWYGLGLFSNKSWKPFETDTALGALIDAFRMSGFSSLVHEDAALPENFILVVVGQK